MLVMREMNLINVHFWSYLAHYSSYVPEVQTEDLCREVKNGT